MKRILWMLLVVGCMGLLAGAGPGTQTLSIDEDMKVDAIGDAAITIHLTLTATQFQNWNQKYGSDTSLLKRDLGKLVSQLDTYDWTVQKDDMNRQVTVGVKAHGLVNHRGGGSYEFDVPKDWKGGQLNGSTVSYNFVESDAGLIEQFNCKITLPPEAKDIKDATGESGQRVLRYSVPVATTSATHWVVMILGIVVTVGGMFVMGLGLLVAVFAGRKKAQAPAAITASAPVTALPSATSSTPPTGK